MLSGLMGATFTAVSSVIDELFTSEEERSQAHFALRKLAQEGRLEKLKVQLSAILAEANSKDPWTSRARPTFLYLIYIVILLCVFGGILGIWYPHEMSIVATNLNALLMSIPESLWWLFGAGYLGYTGARSLEKVRPS